MKIEIVKFKNGKYAVRRKRRLRDYEYLSGRLVWRDVDKIEYCQVGTYEQALELRDRKTDRGEPVDICANTTNHYWVIASAPPKMTPDKPKKRRGKK